MHRNNVWQKCLFRSANPNFVPKFCSHTSAAQETQRETLFPKGGTLPSPNLPAPLRCGRANLNWRNALVLPPRLKKLLGFCRMV